jgi:hypothetical protein
LSDREKETRDYLEKVVHVLSQEIGDRNAVSYDNLEKAKNYIAEDFQGSVIA